MHFGGALRFLRSSELDIVPLAGNFSEHDLQPLGQRGHRSIPRKDWKTSQSDLDCEPAAVVAGGPAACGLTAGALVVGVALGAEPVAVLPGRAGLVLPAGPVLAGGVELVLPPGVTPLAGVMPPAGALPGVALAGAVSGRRGRASGRAGLNL